MAKKLREIVEQTYTGKSSGWYSKDHALDLESAVGQHRAWSKDPNGVPDRPAKIAEVKKYINNHVHREAADAQVKFKKGDKVKDHYGQVQTVNAVNHPMVSTDKNEFTSPGGGIHHNKLWHA